jgi:hypothetical protein
MVWFMIYLLETGICITLLYLAYWMFLRKETYFNFNRLYLVGSILLALTVPLLHLSISIPRGSTLEPPAMGVLKFRQGYGELIRFLDADFGTEPGLRHTADRDRIRGEVETDGVSPGAGSHGETEIQGPAVDQGREHKQSMGSFASIFFVLYIGGVLCFLARFAYLVIRLCLLAKHNGVTRQDGFRMVEIEEEISPFSFFRLLFIHKGSFDDAERHQVLEHEKAHIRQKHSADHLFAHGLAVFQWFNPFAWQIRKALKTTHEYIADRQVIDRGVERIDYQALLLKQMIGYHSAELVNNFNLKPIKKRIAMMNKNRPGWPAKLKAMLVVPFAILVFFLFADLTLKETGSPIPGTGPDLQGLWIGQMDGDFSPFILIKGNRFSYTEGVEIRDFNVRTENGTLILSDAPGPMHAALKFELNGEQLLLWWNDSRSTGYTRSKAENTLDDLLLRSGLHLDLPYISQYRLMEDETRLYRLSMSMKGSGETSLAFDGQAIPLSRLADRVEEKRGKLNKIDQSSLTALFMVDRQVPMAEVDRVRGELRKMEALHIAEGGYPQGDLDLSPLIYHAVALPRLLPPLHAKTLDKKEVEKLGVKLHTIDLSARNTTPREVDEGFREFIGNTDDGGYVISLEYDGDIPYGQYVEAVDMVWKTVYNFRNRMSMDHYSVPYDKLGEDLQREIRRRYPIALSEKMNN